MNNSVDTQSLADKAATLDAEDVLREFRDQFLIPTTEDGDEEIYFVGNSLGLQPKQTREYVVEVLDSWQHRGVRGHTEGDFPWLPYHEFLTVPMAGIVGGSPDEVVMMNGLTTNLHLMMATFFRPTRTRRKILLEEHAFPSDYFAIESQLRWHGMDPQQEMVVLSPDGNEETINTQKILQAIEYYRDSLALVMLPGVQYYTGQVFDMETITRTAHEYDIPVGFDLAHAAGNVELKLHDWDVDFAVWCSYKYLNSGPGSVAGCFIHQRHVVDTDRVRLAGWWGQDKSQRFLMENRFQAIPTVEGWQLSNPPILSLAAVRASLDVFERAGIESLLSKSKSLTGFLIDCIDSMLEKEVDIITPRPATERGCQLSLKVNIDGLDGKVVHQQMEQAALRTDWREPNVIRAAPVPLYNTYGEVFEFVSQLKQIVSR